MDWEQINRNVENIASVGQAKHESSYPSRKGTGHYEVDNQFTSLTSEGAGDVSASISVSENQNVVDTAQGKLKNKKSPVFQAVPSQRQNNNGRQ